MDKNIEKTEGEKLAEKLLSNHKNGGLILSDSKLKKALSFSEDYKDFLNKAKTEREAVIQTVKKQKTAAFRNLSQVRNMKPEKNSTL